jgi:hypothetical protein
MLGIYGRLHRFSEHRLVDSTRSSMYRLSILWHRDKKGSNIFTTIDFNGQDM